MYTLSRTVDVIVGGWYGDEGKGKIVSFLAGDYQHVARAGVGPNAGHTVAVNGSKYGLRMIPSGFTNEDAKLYIGRGVLVDPDVLLREIEECSVGPRTYVDRLCPIIEERHIEADKAGYNKDVVGSTGTGCGPAQLERVGRSKDLKFARDIAELGPYLVDVSSTLLGAIDNGERVLIEMTQGTMLSLYAFEIDGDVTLCNSTSKDTTAGSACADVGIGPTHIKDVIVVYKAIPSRVGQGKFPGELSVDEQDRLRELGMGEYGTVTGRPRRLGTWTPEVYEAARRTAHMNGATQIALTKIDYAFPGNEGVRDYNKLTSDARAFVENLENELQRPVTLIGTGQDFQDVVSRL